MSKTKRLLSVTLAIAMIILSAFSAFADGTETVVEPLSGTVAAGEVTVELADTEVTEVTVPVTITFTNSTQVSPHGQFDISATGATATLKSAAFKTSDNSNFKPDETVPDGAGLVDKSIYVDADGVNTANGRVVVESDVSEGKQPSVSYVTVDVVLEFATALTAGQVVDVVISNIAATNLSEAPWTGMEAVNGTITVKADVTHEAATDWSYDEKNHWHACVVDGCTEHTYDVAAHTLGDYVASEDGTTETATCSANCGYSVSKDIVVDTTLDIAFSAKTLSLKSAIAINYFVTATDFDGYDEFYVDIVQYLADGTTRTEKLEGTYVYTSGVGYEYQFDYTGIAAKEMNDRVYATICAVKDGVTYSSVPEEYGVYTYAYGRLEKSSNAKLKTTLVDMLNYGAAAQLYLNYNKENLANAALTDEQKALGTTTVPKMTNYRNLGSTSDTLTVEHTSPALSLKSSVGITYYSKLTSYTGDKNNLSLVFTYADDMDPVVVPFSEMEAEGSEYKYAFYNVTARQMRNVCTFVWYENYGTDNQVAVSDTMTYSIESYAQSKYLGSNELLSNVVLEMMRYSDSAKAYLG